MDCIRGFSKAKLENERARYLSLRATTSCETADREVNSCGGMEQHLSEQKFEKPQESGKRTSSCRTSSPILFILPRSETPERRQQVSLRVQIESGVENYVHSRDSFEVLESQRIGMPLSRSFCMAAEAPGVGTSPTWRVPERSQRSARSGINPET